MNPWRFLEAARSKFEADRRRVKASLRLLVKELQDRGQTAAVSHFTFEVTLTGFWIVRADSLRVELRERSADALIAAVARAYNLQDLSDRLLEHNRRKARARAGGFTVR